VCKGGTARTANGYYDCGGLAVYYCSIFTDSIRAVHASHGWHVSVNVVPSLTTDRIRFRPQDSSGTWACIAVPSNQISRNLYSDYHSTGPTIYNIHILHHCCDHRVMGMVYHAQANPSVGCLSSTYIRYTTGANRELHWMSHGLELLGPTNWLSAVFSNRVCKLFSLDDDHP
jgi:hypothetical protein